LNCFFLFVTFFILASARVCVEWQGRRNRASNESADNQFLIFLLASKFPRFRRSVCWAAAARCWAPACFDQYANRAFLCMISQRDSNLLTQKVELSVARPESREFVFRFPLIVIQHEFVDSYIDGDVISGLPSSIHANVHIFKKKGPCEYIWKITCSFTWLSLLCTE
jgi:hypothetical protein